MLSATGQRSRPQGVRGGLDPQAVGAVVADLRAQEGHVTREALMRVHRWASGDRLETIRKLV
eukprot:5869159-Pyramimonas_sp.AAC.1